MIGTRFESRRLTDGEVKELCARAFDEHNLSGKKVIVIIPDGTRTAPIPLFFRLFNELLAGRVKKLDYLIALGTHPPMTEARINRLLGISRRERAERCGKVNIFNHHWDQPDELRAIGTISADEIAELSGGLMRESIAVSVNKRIFDYDHLIICGPTFPHEVVGFSGGNKYLFPGIAGPEVLHFFHWLGAVITNPVINGAKWTPVRRVVDHAASLLKMPKLCFSLVVHHGKLHGLYGGSAEEAWSSAADLSARLHIVYKDRTYRRVLSMAPKMYDDIWTAGKCMYKLEPILAEGADLIIYAPHISEISYTHGQNLDRIGYHVRDYFLKQMDRFRDIPRAVLAHSTHVKGIGTFDGKLERPRVNVILATKVPPNRCKRVNLGYMDPDSINPTDYEDREDEGVLCVQKAGETLYRLSDGAVPQTKDDKCIWAKPFEAVSNQGSGG